MAAGGVIVVHGGVVGHRRVWLAETPALCRGLREHGLGEMAAAVHAIAAGAYGKTVVCLKFVHSSHIVDELLDAIRSGAVVA